MSGIHTGDIRGNLTIFHNLQVGGNLTVQQLASQGISIDFADKTLDLTRFFSGREQDREKLRKYIAAQENGYLLVTGAAGIGKSTFLAQLWLELTREQRPDVHYLAYFFAQGTESGRINNFFASLKRQLDAIMPTDALESYGPEATSSAFYVRLRTVAEALRAQGRRLVLLVDGLDELDRTEDLQFLPKDDLANVLTIYASRAIPQVTEDFWLSFNPYARRERRPFDLQGLEAPAVESLLQRALGPEESRQLLAQLPLEQIVADTQGNPLHLLTLARDWLQSSADEKKKEPDPGSAPR